MNSTETKMDFFEIGDTTSLICTDSSLGDVIRSTLRELHFKFHTADSADQAIERTRYTSYDMIIIQENFAGATLKSNTVLNYVSALPMAERRYSMMVLIGESFKTLDAMQAFTHSVQLVVNVEDILNLTAILKKTWAEFESLYKTYKDVFAGLGEK